MVTEELRHAVDGMGDGAVILDGERRVLHYNAPYARFAAAQAGGSRRRLAQLVEKGVRCYELFPLDVCNAQCVGCRAAQAGVPLSHDGVRALGREGEEQLDLVVSATPLPSGLIVESYRDVTAEMRVMRRYRDALQVERDRGEELERAVQLRTQDLARANEELKRTQATLVQQEKMSSLGLLVAGVAHEINNPLNFIVCNLPFLEEYIASLEKVVDASGPPSPALAALRKQLDLDYQRTDAPALLKSIKNGAQRAVAIVADLRSFSRGGDGQPAETDLVAGLESTLNLLAPQLKKNSNVKLVKRFAPLPRVVAQAGQINQVFMNVVGNAIQALEGREGTVEVSTSVDSGYARIDVRDDGCGIAPDHLKRIFDPFFTTKPVGAGTGLGLSISYSIIERHGGQLLVASEPGAGTVFSILLPFPRSPE